MNKQWRKTGLAWTAIGAFALALAGCGAAGKENTAPQTEPAKVVSSEAGSGKPAAGALKTQYPLKEKDATGNEFTFAKAPDKIASVSPAETEILFALGLGDKIVGVSDFDDYPAEAKSKPKLGGVVKPNTEAMIATGADIIFTGVSMKKDAVEQLRGMNLNLFKVEPKTVADVMNDVLQFGRITDRQEQAEQVVAKMKADMQKVQDAVKSVPQEQKKKVYVEFSPGWTVGKGEFMDELITLAGGINVAADTKGWNQISEEKIIQANPDVILYASDVVDDKTKKTMDQLIRGRSGWDQINAIKNNRVIGLASGPFNRPGPRLTEGLLAMAKAIYPDLVK
ncbi:ABC transporter substrate-binding protein [Gordoniibacillus kamchatkensis]|uniref:ABC transporter substrate-binding protein n=1 Tax=Gordoniibacillus kamchatkensis TaxID=1590651 RepID=A0ABR5A772_9BACL|nr:ABC transporter substrate-binding protein [Paenibacillus sp. VKM B-2647]KIL36252.1 ABC transporter substrate-binding protein [Paenibacillus sp. VKM B-2647]